MKSLLSVQSSVLHGYVGNESAALIYPALGIEMARIDTIHLAAHPGHLVPSASPLSATALRHLLSQFSTLPAAKYLRAVHSGYLATADQADALSICLSDLRDASDDTFPYLLDPVLGDRGKFYVDEAIASVMRTKLLPNAQIITPNAFELSVLSEKPVYDVDSAIAAAMILLQDGPHICFATGIKHADQISDILVMKDGTICQFHNPAQKIGVSGAGDCLAALFFGLYLSGSNITKAAERASIITHEVMRTANDSRDMPLFINRHHIKANLV